MIWFVSLLIMVCGLTAPSYASAACRRLGTQLECDFGANRVVIGTPSEARSTKDPPVRPRPLELELQDVGPRASLCPDLPDETDCD